MNLLLGSCCYICERDGATSVLGEFPSGLPTNLAWTMLPFTLAWFIMMPKISCFFYGAFATTCFLITQKGSPSISLGGRHGRHRSIARRKDCMNCSSKKHKIDSASQETNTRYSHKYIHRCTLLYVKMILQAMQHIATHLPPRFLFAGIVWGRTWRTTSPKSLARMEKTFAHHLSSVMIIHHPLFIH